MIAISIDAKPNVNVEHDGPHDRALQQCRWRLLGVRAVSIATGLWEGDLLDFHQRLSCDFCDFNDTPSFGSHILSSFDLVEGYMSCTNCSAED